MNAQSQAGPPSGTLLLDAEALYQDLKRGVQQLTTPQARLVGIGVRPERVRLR